MKTEQHVAILVLWVVWLVGIALLSWFFLGCAPTPTVPHDFRDAGANPMRIPCDEAMTTCQACMTLVHLGCPEGCGGGMCITRGHVGKTCAAVLQSVLDTHLTNPNVPCVLRAQSGAEVRACGPYWVDACEGL